METVDIESRCIYGEAKDAEPVGNAAAMREALGFVAHMNDSPYTTYDVLIAVQMAQSALAAPPRNCDLYSHDEALRIWSSLPESKENGCFDEWLYAEAKGENKWHTK